MKSNLETAVVIGLTPCQRKRIGRGHSTLVMKEGVWYRLGPRVSKKADILHKEIARLRKQLKKLATSSGGNQTNGA